MKARYRLTPKADRDLAQIWRYTNENWGKSQATNIPLAHNPYSEYLEPSRRVTRSAISIE